eukprot:928144-Alexandrium_andersonii.AAC.1
MVPWISNAASEPRGLRRSGLRGLSPTRRGPPRPSCAWGAAPWQAQLPAGCRHRPPRWSRSRG